MPRGLCEMAEIAGHGKGTINDLETGGYRRAIVLAEQEQG
jgi:hypothetical protein